MFISITKGIWTSSILVIALCLAVCGISLLGLGYFIRPLVEKRARAVVLSFKPNSWQRSLGERYLLRRVA
jgi:hypothetical protein